MPSRYNGGAMRSSNCGWIFDATHSTTSATAILISCALTRSIFCPDALYSTNKPTNMVNSRQPIKNESICRNKPCSNLLIIMFDFWRVNDGIDGVSTVNFTWLGGFRFGYFNHRQFT